MFKPVFIFIESVIRRRKMYVCLNFTFFLSPLEPQTKSSQKTRTYKTKTHKHGDFSGDLSGPIEAVVSFRCVVCVRVSLTLSIVSLSLSLSLRLFLARDLEKKCISLFLDMMEKRESNRALLA